MFLSSPGNQMHAHLAREMPVLFSFANWCPWMGDYAPTYPSVLLDSGAFSELNSGKRVDLGAYRDFVASFPVRPVAYAGLDDIRGDWRRSLRNYEAQPGAFPTFHDSDPDELLDDLIPMARERGGWLGIGLQPPRHGKRRWVQETLERIPDDIHVHGWALLEYLDQWRIDSVDSTTWMRKGIKIRKMLPWLTTAEAIEIVVKREQRRARAAIAQTQQATLFEECG